MNTKEHNEQSISMFIGGAHVDGSRDNRITVRNPATQEVLGSVGIADAALVNTAVSSAHAAFLKWRHTPAVKRGRIMLRYQQLLKEHQQELAHIVCEDLGKNIDDARGEVWRGIEVAEQAANIAATTLGRYAEQVATDVDTYAISQPVGVFAGITPFNFPAMIPLWMMPLAIACGNGFVLKPSEQDPLCPLRLVELLVEAGAPANIVQLLHGDRSTVEHLIAHPLLSGVSFVGSVPVAKSIYLQAAQEGKRVQALGGAKNHMVVMPDADKTTMINSLVGAACGAAGQRCMAISVVILVGEARSWIPDIAKAMAALKPGYWKNPDASYGPLISPAAKERVLTLIAQGKKEGAQCLLDGSAVIIDDFSLGNWVGPSLFSDVTTDMAIYREEIFGPVLCAMEASTLDEAIAIINAGDVGNGTSIFTSNGVSARTFQHNIEVGMVGINVPIPVPIPLFSFSGWKNSFMGDLHAYGTEGVKFYTRTKTITARWSRGNTTTTDNSVNFTSA